MSFLTSLFKSDQDFSKLQALMLASFGFFCFGAHDAMGKFCGIAAGFMVAAFLIQMVRLGALSTFLLITKKYSLISNYKKPGVLSFSVLQASGMLGFYIAVIHLPFVELFIILLLRPALGTLLAVLFLKERLSFYRVGALILGAMSVAITFDLLTLNSINLDTLDYNIWGVTGAVINVITMSIRYTVVKKYTVNSDGFGMMFYSGLLITAISFPFIGDLALMLQGNIAFEVFIFAAFAGLVGLLGEFILLRVNQSPHVVVGILSQYSILIWVLLYGWLFFTEVPDMGAILGCVIVAFSGLCLYFDARKRKI